MNVNQIVNMVQRVILRRLINKGLNKGLGQLSRGGRGLGRLLSRGRKP